MAIRHSNLATKVSTGVKFSESLFSQHRQATKKGVRNGLRIKRSAPTWRPSAPEESERWKRRQKEEMKATLVNLSDHARHCPALPVVARHAPEEVTVTWRLAMVLF